MKFLLLLMGSLFIVAAQTMAPKPEGSLDVFNSVSPTPESQNLRPPLLPEPTEAQKKESPSIYDPQNTKWIESPPVKKYKEKK